MTAAQVIFTQIIKMFIMMVVGFVLFKKHVLNEDRIACLSNILLMIATPCTLITSFNQNFSIEKLKELLLSFAFSFIIYFLFILAAKLLYPKKDARIERFAVVFSNAGFIGIPLVSGLMGIEAVFYLSPYIVCFYLFVWTYGVMTMSGLRDSVSFKKIVSNPCLWAVLLGLIVFLLPVKPAAPIMDAISMMGSMNTPMAMIILGAYLGKEPIITIFKDRKSYQISLYRLIVLPLGLILLFKFVPLKYETIRLIMLIAAAAPVGALAPVFAQMFNQDIGYAARTVSLSTILSLISMPLLLLLTEMIW